MRKLHDLKILLSSDAQLSRLECKNTKGGNGEDLRRDRHSDGQAAGLVSGSGGNSGGGSSDLGGLFGGG